MNDISTAEGAKPVRRLYGPTIQYSDGRTVPGQPLDVENILAVFEQSNAETRRVFLSVFAHDLTVAVRAILFDNPLSDADIEKIKEINETLHQLTSCVNPRSRWSAHDETLLLRAVVDASFAYDIEGWIGHALAAAAGNSSKSKRHVAAT